MVVMCGVREVWIQVIAMGMKRRYLEGKKESIWQVTHNNINNVIIANIYSSVHFYKCHYTKSQFWAHGIYQ